MSSGTHAAADFDDSGWGAEQSVAPSGWSAMTRSDDRFAGRAGTMEVDRFGMSTAACASCSIARTWTAAHDGVVSIRSVIANRGSTVNSGVAKIMIDSRELAVVPLPRGDTLQRANLDEVAVRRGQMVRFVASSPSSLDVSWAPAIGFVK